MTIFFLAVGLEIGREVAEGSLRDRRNALLPVVSPRSAGCRARH